MQIVNKIHGAKKLTGIPRYHMISLVGVALFTTSYVCSDGRAKRNQFQPAIIERRQTTGHGRVRDCYKDRARVSEDNR